MRRLVSCALSWCLLLVLAPGAFLLRRSRGASTLTVTAYVNSAIARYHLAGSKAILVSNSANSCDPRDARKAALPAESEMLRADSSGVAVCEPNSRIVRTLENFET